MAQAILVLNTGSSSTKFSVFALAAGDRLSLDAKGQVEGIGTQPRFVARDAAGGTLCDEALEDAGHALVMEAARQREPVRALRMAPVRRYGFHGLFYEYVAHALAEVRRRSPPAG
jgi:acetate kinase